MTEPTRIDINSNVIDSKTVGFVFGAFQSPEEIIIKCNQEILSGLNLNTKDLWAYVSALEMIANSLKTQMDAEQTDLYNEIKQKSKTITFLHYEDEENPSE